MTGVYCMAVDLFWETFMCVTFLIHNMLDWFDNDGGWPLNTLSVHLNTLIRSVLAVVVYWAL